MNLTDRALWAVEVVEDVLNRVSAKSPVVVLTRNQRTALAMRHWRLGLECAEHGITLAGMDSSHSKRHLRAVQ